MAITHSFDNPAAVRAAHHRIAARAAKAVHADLHPGVYVSFVGCWAALIAVFLATFAESPFPPATLRLSPLNFGPLPMAHALTRLQRQFLAAPEHVEQLHERIGHDLDAAKAEALGLVTFIPDDIDWHDEVRLALEERASFSPDALTGMESSLRFAGPETLESKIFGRLSAWQNWIFQRPNAVGAEGALTLYGTGKKSLFDQRRV